MSSRDKVLYSLKQFLAQKSTEKVKLLQPSVLEETNCKQDSFQEIVDFEDVPDVAQVVEVEGDNLFKSQSFLPSIQHGSRLSDSGSISDSSVDEKDRGGNDDDDDDIVFLCEVPASSASITSVTHKQEENVLSSIDSMDIVLHPSTEVEILSESDSSSSASASTLEITCYQDGRQLLENIDTETEFETDEDIKNTPTPYQSPESSSLLQIEHETRNSFPNTSSDSDCMKTALETNTTLSLQMESTEESEFITVTAEKVEPINIILRPLISTQDIELTPPALQSNRMESGEIVEVKQENMIDIEIFLNSLSSSSENTIKLNYLTQEETDKESSTIINSNKSNSSIKTEINTMKGRNPINIDTNVGLDANVNSKFVDAEDSRFLTDSDNDSCEIVFVGKVNRLNEFKPITTVESKIDLKLSMANVKNDCCVNNGTSVIKWAGKTSKSCPCSLPRILSIPKGDSAGEEERGDCLMVSLNHHDPTLFRTYRCLSCDAVVEQCKMRRSNEYYRFHDYKAKFTCHICCKSYYTKSQLKRHAARHEKPYECPECDKKFCTRSELKDHTVVHTDRRPYACPHCQQTYRHSSSFYSHIIHKHQQSQHICISCGGNGGRQMADKYTHF